jgi:hypothetical protein
MGGACLSDAHLLRNFCAFAACTGYHTGTASSLVVEGSRALLR